MSLVLAFLVAQSEPILNNPAPQTGSNGSPITMNDCSFLYREHESTRFVYRLRIEFSNESSKTADLVTFAVKSDIGDATIRDVGSYSPGSEVRHEFRTPYYGTKMDATGDENLRCTVQAIHFTDGTVWEHGSATAAPVVSNAAIKLGVYLENTAAGVVVKFVAPGGLADAAGVRQSDRIVSIGSNTVTSTQEFITVMEMIPAGTTIPLVVERHGTTVKLEVRTTSPARP